MAVQKAELTLFGLAVTFAGLAIIQLLHAFWIFVHTRGSTVRPRVLVLLSSLSLVAGHVFAFVTALLSLALDLEAKGLTKQSSAILTTFTIFFQGLAAIFVFLAAKHATTDAAHGAESRFVFSGARRALRYINETLVVVWLLVVIAHSVTLPFINDPLFSKSQDDLAHIISLDCITDTFGWAFSALSVLAIGTMVYACVALRSQLSAVPEGMNHKVVELLSLGLAPLLVAEAVLIVITIALTETLNNIVALAVAYFIIRGVLDLAVVWVLIAVAGSLYRRESTHSKLETAGEASPLAPL